VRLPVVLRILTNGGGTLKTLRIALEITVIVVFVLLLKQNWELRHLAAKPAHSTAFEAGQTLPPVKVTAADGKQGVLDPGSGRKLLLIGDPRCPSCETILQKMPADNAMVLSIANPDITRSSSFASKYHGPIYSLAEAPRDPRLHRVPQLLLVDSGRVVKTCTEPADCR